MSKCASAFPENFLVHSSKTTRKPVMRCKACLTCQKCKEDCSAHRFRENEKVCRRCQRAKMMCEVCCLKKCILAFPEQLLVNATATSRTTVLRCTSCMTCRKCKENCSAHRFHKNDKVCMRCTGDILCQVCKNHKHPSALSQQLLVNAAKKNKEANYQVQELYDMQEMPKKSVLDIAFTRPRICA